MKKHITKFRILAVVMILVAALGVAYSQAWFIVDVPVEDATNNMGTVDIEVTAYDNESVTLANSSNIDIACRIGLIPQWLDNPDGVNTIADISTMTITSTTDGWKAIRDSNGKWFLVCKGFIAPTVEEKIVTYIATWTAPNSDGELIIEPIAEAIQNTTNAKEYANKSADYLDWEVN